jgi:hypothetical protein
MNAFNKRLAFVFLSGACVGDIDSPESQPSAEADAPAAPGASGKPGEAAAGTPAGAAGCPVSASSGRVVARRLSRAEYNNTVRDLFGFDVGRPADDFPEDVTGGDDDNNNGLTVSELLFEKAEAAAGRLARLALDNGFVGCDPTKIDRRACARQTLEPFMARAWRRPVTPAEVDGVLRYLALVEAERGEKDPFGQAIALAIQHVLLSPSFLFRFEIVENPASPAPQRLNDHDLASRLSYFIYGSMPDPPLFAAARSGKLRDPRELEAQVRRMLADPKAQDLVDRLAGGWLWGHRVDLVNPKASAHPTFDGELRQSLKKETALFVRELLVEDRDFRDALDADFTYVNERLAKHYKLAGAAGVLGKELKRISLATAPERGGLLTQGATLAATSAPLNIPTAEVIETNVIVRGLFVLEHLLCSHLPAPPEGLDVGQIQADAQKNVAPTAPRKEREAVRQTMAACAGCHSVLDPLGFSMEHFDVTGVWRSADTFKTPVDSTGVLKGDDGRIAGRFDGARSLGTLLKNDRRFAGCVTKAVFNLAVGRSLTGADQCRMQRLTAASAGSGHRLRELMVSMTKDESFTHQQGEAP